MGLFAKMGFVWKFNHWMAQTGIGPTSLPREMRQAFQDIGLDNKLKPQEAVAVAVRIMQYNGNLPMELSQRADDVIYEWKVAGDIDGEKVRKLGYHCMDVLIDLENNNEA